MTTTGILYDDRFLEHETGDHPECPERLRSIVDRLQSAGLWEGRPRIAARPVTDEEILRVHDVSLLDALRRVDYGGGGMIDPDTVMSPRTFEVARLAAGGGIEAVDAVLDGRVPRALCLVRPPGHHATRRQAMGFCFLDNVAVAAAHLRQARGLKKVAIIDWDVHHGNGTQDIFYEDPTVLFVSLHRFPFYPGTGSARETGAGAGAGYTVNVPLPAGTSRAQYLDIFARTLEEKVAPFEPEFILISAGFDAYVRDPIGGLGLEVMDFATLTHGVAELARRVARDRVVSFLEGGYHLDALGHMVEAHLVALDQGGD